jgi:hypothetical protein
MAESLAAKYSALIRAHGGIVDPNQIAQMFHTIEATARAQAAVATLEALKGCLTREGIDKAQVMAATIRLAVTELAEKP